MRVLVVEDESSLGRVLQTGLKAEQFAVDLAHDGEEAVEFTETTEYDLVLLDLTLPKLDGLSVLKRLRRKKMTTPVIILSGRDSVQERVRGLDSGADDFVCKPFAFEELMARINALLRRPAMLMDRLVVGDLEIDRVRRVAKRGGKPIPLTQREYALLEYLMRNAGRPVSRTMVVEHVWSLGFEGLTNIVDVYINYLRAKVDQGFEKKLIHTARGIGYMVSDHEEAVAAVA